MQLDLQSPEFRANPYPALNAIRDLAPAVADSEEMHWIGGYDDCDVVLRDNAHFGRELRRVMTEEELANFPDVSEDFKPVVALQRHMMLFRDPPNHTRLRGLVSKAFTPKMVRGLKDSIGEIADDLINRVYDDGGMDLIEDFALTLPVKVIARMLGAPEDDHIQLRQWTEHFLAANDFTEPSPERMQMVIESNQQLSGYIRNLIDFKRKNPDDKLLSNLIAVREEGDQLSEDELLSTSILILFAGFETTTNLIGNGMMLLLNHPEQWQKLKNDLSLIPLAAQEALRYEPPVMATGRAVLADYNLHGIQLDRLSFIGIIFASANRDPRKYTNPDVFDITRDEAKPLTFGGGIHYCLGAPLALLEAEVAFNTIIQRVPDLKLVSDQVSWRDMFVLRGLETLHMTF